MIRGSDITKLGWSVVGCLVVLLIGAALPWSTPLLGQAADNISGGGGIFYTGTYADRIHVVDEMTLSVIDTIPTQNGIVGRLVVSDDRERIYVTDATYQHVEVIDLASRESVDKFTLNDGNRTFRIRGGFAVDPQETYALITGSSSAHVTVTESAPVSGVAMRNELVAPLLAPALRNDAATGSTEQEQSGSGAPMSAALPTDERSSPER